jgi:solute carrier family 25 (mitochondrial oxoglutarate transporter), member 11
VFLLIVYLYVTVHNPLLRLQLPYKGIADCAAAVLRKEGVLAFWTGFTAYYGRCAPHAMIILMSIETITAAYREAFGLK